MPRGGLRENAGRKSGWNHPETQVIRVPKAIAEQLLEIAKKLDRGESLESVSESDIERIDSDTDSKDDLVAESIKHILTKWRGKADAASPKNDDWRKVRRILSELEPVVYERKVLDSVAESKVPPGQMSLLESLKEEQEANESVTDSEESHVEAKDDSIDSVTNSPKDKDWLTTKECWERLGKPGSYETFRKSSPEKLKQLYGVSTEIEKRGSGKRSFRLLRMSDSAGPSNQVNPLPEGSERSEEG